MNEDDKRISHGWIFSLLILGIILFLLINVTTVIEAMREALKMCAHSIIPSLFPFMLLSDILVSRGDVYFFADILGKPLEKIFKISRYGAIALVLGVICGFPIGGKLACSLSEDGFISEEECARLASIANCASPAFVIGTVGVVFLSDYKIGIILYVSQLLSVLLFSLFTKRSPSGIGISLSIKNKKKKSLTDSVKDSAISALFLSSFIISFALISRLVAKTIPNLFITNIITAFLEIGSSAKSASILFHISPISAILILSFSISFSGLSVYMQTKSYFDSLRIKMRGYIVAKFVQGVISVLITFFLIKIYLSTF